MPDPDRPVLAHDEAQQLGFQRELLAYATEFLVFVDEGGRLRASTGPSLEILGYGPDERTGRHIAEHIHPDDLPAVLDLVERARRTPDFEETIHARARHKDGRWLTFTSTVRSVYDHPVLGTGAVIRVRHSGELGEEDPAEESTRFLSLAESLPLGILSADRRSWVLYSNRTAQEVLALPADAIRGHGWLEAVHAEDRPDVQEALRIVVELGAPATATFRIETGFFPRWSTARFVPLGEGRRTGWIATIEDVTDRRRIESELAHRATHDALTGLPNRNLLEDRLDQACARVRRDPAAAVAVLFVDLDDFKEINDRFGHAVGDALLRHVAQRLGKVIRPTDTAARLGGDEFVVVCEGLGQREAERVRERVEDVLCRPVRVDGTEIAVSASVGMARADDTDSRGDELLARSDQAMYRRKRRRR